MTTFTTEQSLPVSFKIVDGLGRPGTIDGEPVIASSDETVATASPVSKNDDGSYIFSVASVAEGPARITVTADAKMGEEVMEIVGFLDVDVEHDDRTDARTIELVAGEPVDEATPA